MAVQYQIIRDEIHIYRNRMPKANGGDPLLGSAWYAALLGTFWLLILTVLLVTGTYRVEQVAFWLAVAFISFSIVQIAKLFMRVVFSVRKQEAYHALLFFKWGRVPFDKIAEITLSEQEMQGKPRFFFIARLRDEFAVPLRLSPRAKTSRHLSRYYYEIIPHLVAMLAPYLAAAAEDAAEVAVEEFEVPVDEAQGLIPDGQERVPPALVEMPVVFPAGQADEEPAHPQNESFPATASGNEMHERAKPRESIFKDENGIFSRSLWLHNMTVFFVGVLMTVAINGLFIWLDLGVIVTYLSYGLIVYGIGQLVYRLSKENMNFQIDTNRRVVRFKTMFGLADNVYDFDAIRKFTMKSNALSNALCVEISGHFVDPTIVPSSTSKKVKGGYAEVCEIMQIDPKRYWKV